MKAILISLLLLSLGKIHAGCPNELFAGPEVYGIRRWRDGGTRQQGLMNGVRAGYERLKPHGWYFGFDYLYATGELKGTNSRGTRLKSELTDNIWEARVGYMLQNCGPRSSFFVPFGGYGHFSETNGFYGPSPIPFTFTDTFDYVVAGFLSGVYFTPLLSMGINFKVEFMLNGQSKVSDDPDFEDVTLLMNNTTQYRVEIPLSYCLSSCRRHLEGQLVPFYEFRHFGGREGYPFDFADTKFSLIGIRAALAYRF